MNKTNQNGFAGIEAIIIVIVLSLIGVVSYSVYKMVRSKAQNQARRIAQSKKQVVMFLIPFGLGLQI